MKNILKLSPDVHLPVEITTRRSAIFGISGSGKSNTGTRIMELLLEAGEQIVLVDPKGEGWGLQTSADGKRPGYDVILFGQPRGDISELREEHAEQIADFVVDSGRSVVLSMLGFDTDESERRFVMRFCKRLYRRKSQMPVKTRTLVVLEEAHLFIPEQATGKASEMVGAIKKIARQGRSAGMGLMILDQRPQDVAKSVISQCEILICHQLVHKLDRDALRDWVRAYDREGKGETFLNTLAELQPGEAWAWSPAWLHLFVRTMIERRTTYDSGATPDGSPAEAPKARAKVDLDALRSQLSKVVDEQKANDPKALKTELAKLRIELEKAGSKTVEKIKEVQILGDGHVKRLETIAEKLSSEGHRLVETGEKMLAEAAAVRQTITSATARMAGTAQHIQQQERYAVAAVNHRPRRAVIERSHKPDAVKVEAIASGDASLGKCERAILRVLSQFPEGCGHDKLTILAGYTFSGGFRNSLSQLRTMGLIEGGNMEVMRITEAGEAMGPFEPLPTGEKLREYWLNHPSIGKCERGILDALCEAYPAKMDMAELCESTGYEPSGGFRNSLSALRTIGIITGKNTGKMGASDNLF